MVKINVLDSFISYLDIGSGDVPVVFLHGNPTSSYLWRYVIPHVFGQARCLAPDLIGMGSSGKPDIDYRFADHARYLDTWIEELGLEQVVFVGHEWGGALGMDWAAAHPGRVRGVALVETFLRPLRSDDLRPASIGVLGRLRSPEGERMVLQDNIFLQKDLPSVPGLSNTDLAVYRAPYPTPTSRMPMLAWAREYPFDGEPADVVRRVTEYDHWMARTPEVPKLVMAGEDSATDLDSPELIAWAEENFAGVEVETIGPAGRCAPEYQPDAIGAAVADWIRRHTLTKPAPSQLV
ncbi:haloalkane dehalogenase [Nocardia arthritidis]|uniref:Haloalkane dehalogenase n=1 Tax=Nocardia arthritidis TaxID=228602 RepID=A0A6G9YLS2_9NOCA|nr:haloalkane dehalogenase [Nocardia arthritidis]QIS13976.1 haloalkane dehalogenase [Nocardia arthritidis]